MIEYINKENLKKQINQRILTVNEFINFLKQNRRFNISFYSDSYDLKKFPIIEYLVDDEELLEIVIDCDYKNRTKGRKSIKCDTLIKKLDKIQKQYNYDLFLNIKISYNNFTSDGDIHDIFVSPSNKEVNIYLSLIYDTMIYD